METCMEKTAFQIYFCILDIVKIDWASNPCTKTTAICCNSNKQSSLQRCKAQDSYTIPVKMQSSTTTCILWNWASFTNWWGDFDTFWQELASYLCPTWLTSAGFALIFFCFKFAFGFAFIFVCYLPPPCWIFQFGFAFGFRFLCATCLESAGFALMFVLASSLVDLLLAMLLPNMLPSSWRVNSALAHLSAVCNGWWLWFHKHKVWARVIPSEKWARF